MVAVQAKTLEVGEGCWFLSTSLGESAQISRRDFCVQEVEKQYKEGGVKHTLVQVLKAVRPEALSAQGAWVAARRSLSSMPVDPVVRSMQAQLCSLLQAWRTRPRSWACGSLRTSKRQPSARWERVSQLYWLRFMCAELSCVGCMLTRRRCHHLLQMLSSDPNFLRLSKGNYSLHCFHPEKEQLVKKEQKAPKEPKQPKKAAAAAGTPGTSATAAAAGAGTPGKAAKPEKEAVPMVEVKAKTLEVSGVAFLHIPFLLAAELPAKSWIFTL